MRPVSPITRFISLARRGYNKPPHVIALWLWRKFSQRRAASRLPRIASRLTADEVARRLGFASPDAVLAHAETDPPFPLFRADRAVVIDRLGDGSAEKIRKLAARALSREVDMLGSGPVKLGTPIDWSTDFKSGVSWPLTRISQPELLDLERPSDIKIPWELSRLQWLLPVAQAHIIDGAEEHARFCRDVIDEWIAANPICRGPNWICAMDVAMHALSICWIYLACRDSDAWSDPAFRDRVLVQLYLHNLYVIENLEWSDVAGNHLTADLAGLVVVGLFLGGRGQAATWVETGWRLLLEQFPMQVPADGVCREASAPYHRLVAELFLLPALARRACGLQVEDWYWEKLRSMAPFVAAASRPDGEVPVWGDADDGRALPLGNQPLNDHRYLVETLGTLDSPADRPVWDETLWWLGPGKAEAQSQTASRSTAFPDAGAFILRGGADYVFVDAGPVGMAGRGGHGHNDCLSFEAALSGKRLIVDPGCYVYTADWKARNRFRGTAVHNTPMLDGEEINRIPRDDWLWYLDNDAIPDVRHWSVSDDIDLLVASHSGYQRLNSPVTTVRGVMLEKSTGRLFVADGFEGNGSHRVRVPFTFDPDVTVEPVRPGVWRLESGDEAFLLVNTFADSWQARIEDGEVSPSYGVKMPTKVLAFSRDGALEPLAIAVIPEKGTPPDPVRWLHGVVRGCFPVPGLE